MTTSYMKRSLMLLGAAAAIATAGAEGTFVDVTDLYLQEPAYLPAWQGAIGATNEGVAEVWNGAFRTYQRLRNLPAGEYTLTVNAFYRCGNNDFSREKMPTNPDLYTAYIFANSAKQKVAGLFDGVTAAPNDMASASEAFSNGLYLNTLTFNHNGGDLEIGIANTGCYWDEWCCFDNFKLVGPNGEVAIENGDFSVTHDSKRAWNNVNSGGGEKTPDMQKDGSGGGDYRKCGGSPYKYGQMVDLPAGTYRFGMQTFHRYGSEVDAEGNYYNHKWPCCIVETGGYGKANRTPKDWFDANDYDNWGDADYSHAFIFVSKQTECPNTMEYGDPDDEFMNHPLVEGDIRVRIKDCWEINNGDLDAMPHNNPVCPGALNADLWVDNVPYELKNKVTYRNDSGSEREAAAAFVNEPEKYYQYVEFTLDQPGKVWVGLGKDQQTGDGYWHAWANQTLMMLSDDTFVEGIAADENVEEVYYNLNGMRVENPSNGIFIVKKGNKVSKQVIK